MSRSRFIFLSTLVQTGAGQASDGLFWLLISPNSRQLGRGYMVYQSYHGCRTAASLLRQQLAQAKASTAADEVTGQLVWRVDLDGVTVAVSSRSYLRMRECQYNLDRFLEAVPQAVVAEGVRVIQQMPRHLAAEAARLGRQVLP